MWPSCDPSIIIVIVCLPCSYTVKLSSSFSWETGWRPPRVHHWKHRFELFLPPCGQSTEQPFSSVHNKPLEASLEVIQWWNRHGLKAEEGCLRGNLQLSGIVLKSRVCLPNSGELLWAEYKTNRELIDLSWRNSHTPAAKMGTSPLVTNNWLSGGWSSPPADNVNWTHSPQRTKLCNIKWR